MHYDTVLTVVTPLGNHHQMLRKRWGNLVLCRNPTAESCALYKIMGTFKYNVIGHNHVINGCQVWAVGKNLSLCKPHSALFPKRWDLQAAKPLDRAILGQWKSQLCAERWLPGPYLSLAAPESCSFSTFTPDVTRDYIFWRQPLGLLTVSAAGKSSCIYPMALESFHYRPSACCSGAGYQHSYWGSRPTF